MKYNLKTRVLGAALLLAIALIFLPSFFKDKQVAPVSTKTQIPPKPSVTPEEFNTPQPVASIEPAPAPETMFMPDQQSDEASASSAATVPSASSDLATTKTTEPQKSASTSNQASATVNEKSSQHSSQKSSQHSSQPVSKISASLSSQVPVAHLNDKGIPESWMVQVGGFATKEAADKVRDQLQSHGLKAFDRPINNIKGVAAKVFVGPVLEKSQAATIKSQVDKELKVNSMIVKFQP